MVRVGDRPDEERDEDAVGAVVDGERVGDALGVEELPGPEEGVFPTFIQGGRAPVGDQLDHRSRQPAAEIPQISQSIRVPSGRRMWPGIVPSSCQPCHVTAFFAGPLNDGILP